MITLDELNPHQYPTTPEIDRNLNTLLARVNLVEKTYGYPLVPTSGLRSEGDQMRINPSAPKSKHLIGAAVDIGDKNGKLKAWLEKNFALIEKIDLYLEDFDYTPTWVHFQTIPPGSGRRIFIP